MKTPPAGKSLDVLSDDNIGLALSTYRKQETHFPLIGCVLDGSQEGVVLADSNTNPSFFVVIHKFGFSHYFEANAVAGSASSVIDYLMESDDTFLPEKLRWYAPPPVLADEMANRSAIAESERIQWRLPEGCTPPLPLHDVRLLDAGMIAEVDEQFPLNLTGRFWSSAETFVANALGAVGMVDNRMASICYAAGVSANTAEIDVYTREEYRGKGMGKAAALAFIAECHCRGLIPNWDCYSNNIASCRLAESLGFAPSLTYRFFTLTRDLD